MTQEVRDQIKDSLRKSPIYSFQYGELEFLAKYLTETGYRLIPDNLTILSDEEIKRNYYYSRSYIGWDLDEALTRVCQAQRDSILRQLGFQENR